MATDGRRRKKIRRKGAVLPAGDDVASTIPFLPGLGHLERCRENWKKGINRFVFLFFHQMGRFYTKNLRLNVSFNMRGWWDSCFADALLFARDNCCNIRMDPSQAYDNLNQFYKRAISNLMFLHVAHQKWTHQGLEKTIKRCLWEAIKRSKQLAASGEVDNNKCSLSHVWEIFVSRAVLYGLDKNKTPTKLYRRHLSIKLSFSSLRIRWIYPHKLPCVSGVSFWRSMAGGIKSSELQATSVLSSRTCRYRIISMKLYLKSND